MHKSRKPTIVFDLGAVLIDWNPRYLFANIFSSKQEMEHFLTEVCSPEWNAKQDAGRSFAEAIEEIRVKHPKYHEYAQTYFARWPETLGRPISGTVEIFRELKSKGFATAALSNWSAETFHFAWDRFDFLHEFDELTISGREKLAKPDAKIYELVEKRLSKGPSELVFIDDVAANVQAAQVRGWTAIPFVGPEKLREDLKALAILD